MTDSESDILTPSSPNSVLITPRGADSQDRPHDRARDAMSGARGTLQVPSKLNLESQGASGHFELADPMDAILSLATIRSVAQGICKDHKSEPASRRPVNDKDSSERTPCGLERYKAMGRRQPIHVTYHPNLVCRNRLQTHDDFPLNGGEASPSNVSEHLLAMLDQVGLKASLGRQFETGDHYMMVGALAVVLLISPEYIQSSRFQRTLSQAVSLGKCVIPVLLSRNNGVFDDQVKGPILKTLRCIDLSHFFDEAEAAGTLSDDPEWNLLIQRLHSATGSKGPTASRRGLIFVSYCTQNSELGFKYGNTPSFIGPAYADPRKVKDRLEAKNGLSCWIDSENAGCLAEQGMFQGVDAAMRDCEIVLICMSNEYMASELCRNELYHACKCLQKPVVMALVGTAQSTVRHSRWDKHPLADLLFRVPFVDLRKCYDSSDLDKKLQDLHVKVHAVLGREPPTQLPRMRVRISQIAVRQNSLLLDPTLSFFVKCETVGGEGYKCKTHLAWSAATKDVAEEVPAASKTLAPLESDVSKSMVEWRKDKPKFDCKVDESLRVRVFCCQSKSLGFNSQSTAPVQPEGRVADTSPSGSSKLQRKEDFQLGEAIVNLRLDPFEARRTKEFRWHNLSGVAMGGSGIPTYAGQVGFLTETIDFDAARAPKPPPEIADAECQTDSQPKKTENAKGTTTQEAVASALAKRPKKQTNFKGVVEQDIAKNTQKIEPEKPSFDPFFQKKKKFSHFIVPKYQSLFDFDDKPVTGAPQGSEDKQSTKVNASSRVIFSVNAVSCGVEGNN